MAEQFAQRQGKGGGDALDVHQADVATAALHVAEVGAVDAGPTGQVLLRQAQCLPARLDGEAEPLADVSPVTLPSTKRFFGS